jgi:hypothetical protein
MNWKENLLPSFMVLSLNIPGRTEENHRMSVFGLRWEFVTSRMGNIISN